MKLQKWEKSALYTGLITCNTLLKKNIYLTCPLVINILYVGYQLI